MTTGAGLLATGTFEIDATAKSIGKVGNSARCLGRLDVLGRNASESNVFVFPKPKSRAVLAFQTTWSSSASEFCESVAQCYSL